MKLEEFETNGRHCLYYADEEPEVLLVEPLDEREVTALDEELSAIVEEHLGRRKFKGYSIEDIDIQFVVRPTKRKK